ncbi:alpha/beta hydrolase [Streptomyces sp. SAJ15]|uniref:alpha/beta hydrolase n=1 Tax=Streptomyces sp. SAJ15 TaxID=2011095 RepID=UPI0011859391|nr:alpha/beta fold hydrolase [Streptomyces sp. SAJ15]TVL87992.1 alpha/beta hydrolase [Streptomyces sp. SAJ15]
MAPGAEAGTERRRVPPVTRRNTSVPRRVTLLTADGVPIEAAYAPRATAPGTAGDPAAEPVIVVAHGFTGALERPALRRAAETFGQRAAVITFSFRGHGRSGGRSTIGDLEVLDLAAAVRWARRLGHRRVATVGFSMGGSVVLRHAALHRPGDGTGGARPAPGPARDLGHGAEHEGRTDAHSDAVVAVSAPSRWFYRGTAPMRRLHWVVSGPAGRMVSRYGLGTRVAARRWDPVPLSPVAAVPLIAPTPLLIVHGDRDAYFPLDHPRMLAAAAAPGGAELWLEPGFGHAEAAADAALLDRIATWAVRTAAAPD